MKLAIANIQLLREKFHVIKILSWSCNLIENLRVNKIKNFMNEIYLPTSNNYLNCDFENLLWLISCLCLLIYFFIIINEQYLSFECNVWLWSIKYIISILETPNILCSTKARLGWILTRNYLWAVKASFLSFCLALLVHDDRYCCSQSICIMLKDLFRFNLLKF